MGHEVHSCKHLGKANIVLFSAISRWEGGQKQIQGRGMKQFVSMVAPTPIKAVELPLCTRHSHQGADFSLS